MKAHCSQDMRGLKLDLGNRPPPPTITTARIESLRVNLWSHFFSLSSNRLPLLQNWPTAHQPTLTYFEFVVIKR